MPSLTVTINYNQQQNKQQNLSSTLAPYAGLWGKNEIVHLLKRTMFGAAVADVKYFQKKTLQQAVDELVNNSFINTSQPVNDYNNDKFTDPHIGGGKSWINAAYNAEADFLRIYSFKKWQIGQFINQGRTVQMKMMFFWHNHFATHINDLGRSQMCFNHHQLLRKNALGNFKNLTGEITKDCIMLRYLNGEDNTKSAPNENYGRELQELFCVGKGPASGYTEQDVKEMARVLTGWKVNYTNNIAYFDYKEHDDGDKKFSTFYNNTIIHGSKGSAGGEMELKALLNMIFDTQECARFLCRKLYRWFVYHKIDAETENQIIIPLANILRKNNYEIKPVLTALFKSEHFFDVNNYGTQIKSPFDYCIGMIREFNVQFPLKDNFSTNYKLWESLHYYTKLLSQEYGDAPGVSGWPAYYQSPSFYQLWINAATYPRRIEFATALTDYGFERNYFILKADLIEFAKSTSNPADPAALINDSVSILYRVPLSDASKNKLKTDILLNGLADNSYWEMAWGNFMASPKDETKKSVVENRLKKLYHYLVNAPEFQLI